MDTKAPSAGHSSWVLDRPVLYLLGLAWTVLQLLNKSMLELSVTALFYLDDSRKIHLRGVRARQSKDRKRRVPHCAGERVKRALAPLFICFLFPLSLSYANWAQAGALFVLPEVLTPVLGPSFVLFLRAFPFQVFQPPPFWTPFPYSNYLTKP